MAQPRKYLSGYGVEVRLKVHRAAFKGEVIVSKHLLFLFAVFRRIICIMSGVPGVPKRSRPSLS